MTNVFIGVLSLRMCLFEFWIWICFFENAGFGQVLQAFLFSFCEASNTRLTIRVEHDLDAGHGEVIGV